MSAFTSAGSVMSALTHFALFGLAAICEAELGSGARVWWTDERIPRPQLDVGCEPQVVAEAVHRHATERTSSDSWLAVRIDHEGRPTAAFSPRFGKKAAFSRSVWRSLQAGRNKALDQLLSSHASLDLRLIGSLGESAYWRDDKDEGASRWEMKTRNAGQEFVGDRLAPLAGYVADRRVDEVLSGLTGATVNDEDGKNKPESRTATGFARPGPVDNALAWCALWGISQFPVVHHIGAQSATAGTNVPHNRTHPKFVFLPVATRPITLARLRTIIASRHLSVVGAMPQEAESIDEIATDASRKWLADRSIRALIRFQMYVSRNPSAPERQVLDGFPIPVGDPP